MLEARYILRFDDICETMNWDVWNAIEQTLDEFNVRPILAVVPDNQDRGLMVNPPAPGFWERVRGWQAKGYAIALHGYQHKYINREKGMMKLTAHSEFTGLPLGEQHAKLEKGLAIFASHQVRADAFVAPSHSFDATTLEALAALGLKVVSDGLWPWPHLSKGGILFVPQQLWGFAPRPAGTWTVCLHPNEWTRRHLETFARDVERHAPQMTDLATVVAAHRDRRLTAGDRFHAWSDLAWNHRIRGNLSLVKQALVRRGILGSRKGVPSREVRPE